MRANLFPSVGGSATTIVLSLLALALLARFLDWAVVKAVWTSPAGNSLPCRAAGASGACWALVAEKYQFMLFATYPYEERWRPAAACLILIALYVISAIPAFWRA